MVAKVDPNIFGRVISMIRIFCLRNGRKKIGRVRLTNVQPIFCFEKNGEKNIFDDSIFWIEKWNRKKLTRLTSATDRST